MAITSLLTRLCANSVTPQPWSFLGLLKRRHTCKKTFADVTFTGPFLHQHPVIRTRLSSRRGFSSLVPCTATDSNGSGQEDSRVHETLLKLYNAVKNRKTEELSDIIADECRCVTNFFSFFQSIQGKQQVLDFFNLLIKNLGNNIKFVVKPTMRDGMVVGFEWTLESRMSHMILGKGVSFIFLHHYRGGLYISNVELFMEPLVHFEPYRLKLMGYATTVTDKMSLYKLSNNKVKAFLVMLPLVVKIISLNPGIFSNYTKFIFLNPGTLSNYAKSHPWLISLQKFFQR